MVFASNVKWSLLDRLLSRGAQATAVIILARGLGTRDFAIYNYFLLTIAMLGTYATVGLRPAAAKLFAEHGQRQGQDEWQGQIGVLAFASVLLAIAAAAAVLLLPPTLIGGGLNLPSWLFALGALLVALEMVPRGAILGLEEFRRGALLGVATSVVVLVGALVAVLQDRIGVAIAALLLSLAMQVAGLLAIAIRRVGLHTLIVRYPVSWQRIRKLLDLSLPLALSGMIFAGGTWLLGRIILDGPGGVHAFGLYSIGMQWFALSMFLPMTVGTVLLPRMVGHAVRQTDGRSVVRRAVAAVVVAGVCLAIAGAGFSPLALRLYGPAFSSDQWLIAAYMAAGVMASPNATLVNALVAHGRHWLQLAAMFVWGTVLISMAIAARESVVYGAAIAVTCAYTASCAAMWVVARRCSIV